MGTILSGGTFDITRLGADTLPASQNHRAGAADGSRSPRPDRSRPSRETAPGTFAMAKPARHPYLVLSRSRTLRPESPLSG